MKQITRKDYENEIQRLVSILVFEKIDQDADAQIKNLLLENLENYELLKINSTRWKKSYSLKQKCVDSIIHLSRSLVVLKFGADLDKEVKKKISFKLNELGRIENDKRRLKKYV